MDFNLAINEKRGKGVKVIRHNFFLEMIEPV
jgi:hypothetical protein